MNLLDRTYYIWLHLQRYMLSFDLYCAKRSGNWHLRLFCRDRISQLDQQLNSMEVNHVAQTVKP